VRTLAAIVAVLTVAAAPLCTASGRSARSDPGVATVRTVSADQPSVTYAPPVDAPVIDPFRPPATPYGPGNRGLEYATGPGLEARAIGAGRVTFAGQVAGRGVVTVEHADGLRSSLTGLTSISVRAGEQVAGGQVLGTTAAALHLGVRRDGAYIDPASLFAVGGPPRHAVLVEVP